MLTQPPLAAIAIMSPMSSRPAKFAAWRWISLASPRQISCRRASASVVAVGFLCSESF